MVIKLEFGKGHAYADSILSIDCPNEYKGIGDITFKCTEGLWTGDVHVYSPNNILQFGFGGITKVKTRDNLYESDEPWVTVWEYYKPFTYMQYYKLSYKLSKYTKTNWRENYVKQ